MTPPGDDMPAPPASGRVRRFLGGLRSWQLFVLSAVLLGVDLVFPDPIPVVDELVLAVLTYAVSRWKKKPR